MPKRKQKYRKSITPQTPIKKTPFQNPKHANKPVNKVNNHKNHPNKAPFNKTIITCKSYTYPQQHKQQIKSPPIIHHNQSTNNINQTTKQYRKQNTNKPFYKQLTSNYGTATKSIKSQQKSIQSNNPHNRPKTRQL